MSASAAYLPDHHHSTQYHNSSSSTHSHPFQLPTPMASSRHERHSASTAGGSGTGSGGRSATTAAVDVASNNGYGFRSTAGDALSIEVAYLNPRRRFPLADEFLPRVTVSAAQTRELKRVCEQMITDALAKTSLFAWDGSSNAIVGAAAKDWKLHYSKPNLAYYRRRKEQAGDASLRHFVARGQVHSMNLQDVEYGMYCDTTVDERAVMTDLYQELFLDAAVLQVFETQTASDPFHFFGVKWLAHVSPADKFVSPRDYAFVEYSQRVVNKLGEPFLVKVTHSLSTAHVASMNQREFDLVRGVISCTYIYRYDAPSKSVQVFANGYQDPSGSAPGWLSKAFLTKLAPTIVNLEHSADVKYIMRNQLVLTYDAFRERVAAQPKGSKKRCSMCLKAFGRLVSRSHTRCRACAEPVCSHCVLTLTLCVPWHEKRCAERPSAVVAEKFCFKCLYTGRRDRNGKYLLEPLESHGAPTGEDPSELLASKFTQATVSESEDEGWSTDDGDVVSEQDRLRRLRLRHLEREKRKNLGSRRPAPPPTQPLYHGPQPTYNPAAFRDMERSLAEQEALIRSIQTERAKLAQHRTPPTATYAHYSSQQRMRLARASSSEWHGEGSESRFETLDSSDDDDDAGSVAPCKTSRFASGKHHPSISQSTRTTVSSTSDSLGSSWDYRS